MGVIYSTWKQKLISEKWQHQDLPLKELQVNADNIIDRVSTGQEKSGNSGKVREFKNDCKSQGKLAKILFFLEKSGNSILASSSFSQDFISTISENLN